MPGPQGKSRDWLHQITLFHSDTGIELDTMTSPATRSLTTNSSPIGVEGIFAPDR